MTHILTTKSSLGYDGSALAKSSARVDNLKLTGAQAPNPERFFCVRVMADCVGRSFERVFPVGTIVNLIRSATIRLTTSGGSLKNLLQEYATMRTKTITFIHPITGETIVGKEFISKKISPAARRKIAFLRRLSKNMNAWITTRIHPKTGNLEPWLEGFGFARDLMRGVA